MLSTKRTYMMLCDLFTLCGQYRHDEITKEQFIKRAVKLAEEKIQAEQGAKKNDH